ncbi:MAG: flagellar biosynthesis protein FlhB [Spirochaetaceae bacterium]|nr:MAG: flagellar biosynthesis protein FlhB [Spirochaetaceae bacterium]
MKKALGLRYTSDLPAPFVHVKASGRAAERLVELARARGVPVREDSELTNVLFAVDVDTMIPESVYEVVAKLLVFVGAVDAKGRKK